MSGCFPLMGGLLVASIGSGLLVSRWGRYKVFPVVGTALMTDRALPDVAGRRATPVRGPPPASMAVFGFGLGLILQVLAVAVQNAVPYEELGTATSGVNLLPHRSGAPSGPPCSGPSSPTSSVGNVLRALHLHAAPAGLSLSGDDPGSIHRLPAAVQAGVVDGIAHTIQTMFLWACPSPSSPSC